MPTDNQIERLAAMTNAIRPEWPIRSLVTLLTKHAARPYRDLAVALAWVATDARTKTPARLAEAGPWWTATSMTEGQGPTQSRMRCPDHPEQKAGSCAECFKAARPRADLCPAPKRDKHVHPFIPEETS
jgi:hypothetical protein